MRRRYFPVMAVSSTLAIVIMGCTFLVMHYFGPKAGVLSAPDHAGPTPSAHPMSRTAVLDGIHAGMSENDVVETFGPLDERQEIPPSGAKPGVVAMTGAYYCSDGRVKIDFQEDPMHPGMLQFVVLRAAAAP